MSAIFTCELLTIARQYWADPVINAIQAVDLRIALKHNHYDARETLSPTRIPLYEALRSVFVPVRASYPYIADNAYQFLDRRIELVADDLAQT